MSSQRSNFSSLKSNFSSVFPTGKKGRNSDSPTGKLGFSQREYFSPWFLMNLDHDNENAVIYRKESWEDE